MTACRFVHIAAAAFFVAASGRPAAAQWMPPLGIPAPSFGINEVAPATPKPWTASSPGFYYVDATQVSSTDSGNTYGTPAKPRKTIPTTLPAGALVELHGPYDTEHGGSATIVPQGTPTQPVWIRGVSPASKALVRRSWEVKGTYAVLENLEFGPMPDQSDTGSLVIRLPADHVVLRNSDLHGTKDGGGLGIVNWEVRYGEVYTGPGDINNVVIYNNTIHDNGDVNANFDQDAHGIAVSDHVNHLWVVDNRLYGNSGDGIQINAALAEMASSTHHIYVGRNVSHDNKQTGYWVKQATDVIFSQNESYNHRPSNSSMGQCIGGQYAPDYVWWLFNKLHDCEYGIALMSDDGEASHVFAVGNVIYNIHRTVLTNSPDDAWGPSAIMTAGGNERHFVNNTIWNVDSGVNIATSVGSLELSDNIVGNITQPGASHMILGFSALAANTTWHNNLLSGDPRVDLGTGQIHLTDSVLAIGKSISGDPQFIDPSAGDFHVPITSPAMNSGEFNTVYGAFQQRYGVSIAFDADGRPRPRLATTDIGAYVANGTGGQVAPAPTPPSPPSAPACVPTALPLAPTGLTLVSQGGGSMKVAWTRPAGCGVPTSYVVEGATSPGAPGVTVEIPASSTTFQGPIQPGTFYLRVSAKNVSGTGPASNEVQIGGVPGPPGNLNATILGGTMVLMWSAPTTGGTANGFVVEVGSAPGRADLSTTTYQSTTTTASVGKPTGTAYVRVRAVSIAGVSDPSNEVIVR
jgi:hypothetical protein